MNNCPTCHKPYAHTLGVMGYAGPPFWCECIHQPKLPHKDNLLEGMVDWVSKHTVSQEEAKERLSRFDKLPSSLPDETDVKFLEEKITESNLGGYMYIFVVSDYYATGEGQTTSILITPATPRMGRDYEIEPTFNLETSNYFPGKLKHTREQIAVLEFVDRFGKWLSQGIEVLSKDEFEKRYNYMLPESVKNFLTKAEEKPPANFFWSSQFHTNYS